MALAEVAETMLHLGNSLTNPGCRKFTDFSAFPESLRGGTVIVPTYQSFLNVYLIFKKKNFGQQTVFSPIIST